MFTCITVCGIINISNKLRVLRIEENKMKMTDKEIYKNLDKLEKLAYELRFGIDDENKEEAEQIHEIVKSLLYKYIK